MITSTPGSCSSAWATRPPQNEPSPVTRTRRPISPPDAAAAAEHVVELLLDGVADALGRVHDAAARVAGLVGQHVETHGVEHPDAHLGRERHPHARSARGQHVGGDRGVGDAERPGQGRHLEQDRHRLLVADDGHRDDRHPRPHGDLHEPAPPEAAQLVALGVELAGPLRPLGEHHHELLLLAEQAVGVVGVGLDAAEAGPGHVDERHLLEHLVGQPVDGPAELALDAVHDRRGVGRDGAGVVGHHRARHPRGGSCRTPPTRPGASCRRSGRTASASRSRRCCGAAPLVDVGQPLAVGRVDAGVRRVAGRLVGPAAPVACVGGRASSPSVGTATRPGRLRFGEPGAAIARHATPLVQRSGSLLSVTGRGDDGRRWSRRPCASPASPGRSPRPPGPRACARPRSAARRASPR